jgi:glyoxylate/hydroxypyruvate reductase A
MKIFCAVSLEEKLKTILRENLNGLSHVFADELEEDRRLPAFLQSEICFGNVDPSWLEQSDRLQWLQLHSAGFGEYQNIDKKEDLVITNMKGFYGVPVAETALAGIMALFRGMDTLTLLQQDKKWVGGSLRPQLKTLYRKRVLILGGGSIGGHLHQLLKGFDAEVTIFGRRPANSDITEAADLDRVIPEMDLIISCLPETNETINLIDRKRLNLMPPHAVFVNVGRGSVVDEPALISLLQERKIGGAVLDVTAEEPLPPGSPLWTCPNTILTQHTGGGFDDEMLGIVRLFLDNLERYKNGWELLNVVELEKGY